LFVLLPRANAIARNRLRTAKATALFSLAIAATGLGCVDVKPPWDKATWFTRDSGTTPPPGTGEPESPDSAIAQDDTTQTIPPDPIVDAGGDKRLDIAEPIDGREDTRPLGADGKQDGRTDTSIDTQKTDFEDALVRLDQSPEVDAAGPDLPHDTKSPPTDTKLPPSDTGPEALPTQGLVAYYPCENASGSVLADKSGNKKDAALANGSGGSAPVGFSFGQGKVGNGVRLTPGDKAFINLPKGIVSKLGQVTIATWVKVNADTAFQRIFDFGSDTNNFMYLTNSGDTGVRFRIASSNGKSQAVEAAKPLPLRTWTHVALTLGNDGISLFVDGDQVAQQAPAALRASDLGDTSNNYLGRSQFSQDPYLDGSLDEFRIYDRVLNGSEIADLASGR
jgi:hypothetical protein